MKKLMKKKQKGFTLVEVIVVLVILAIMAAILIPSLIGYIDKANENTIKSDTKSIAQATQTILSEAYATGVKSITYTASDTNTNPQPEKGKDFVFGLAAVEKLSELQLDASSCTITYTSVDNFSIVYKLGDKQCTYYSDVTKVPAGKVNYEVTDAS